MHASIEVSIDAIVISLINLLRYKLSDAQQEFNHRKLKDQLTLVGVRVLAGLRFTLSQQKNIEARLKAELQRSATNLADQFWVRFGDGVA